MPRRKKRKTKCKNESTTITSNLFLNFSDLKQFQNIAKQIQQCKCIKSMNVPDDIIKQIAEFSTGTIKQCSNYKCKNDMSILKEYTAFDLLDYDESGNEFDDEFEEENKFMVYKNSNNETQFISNEACNEFYCLDCTNNCCFLCKDCWCRNVPTIITHCDRCNKCNKPLTECDGCDFQHCYCKRECLTCDAQYCAIDAEEVFRLCEMCGNASCKDCMKQVSFDKDADEYDIQYVCSDCCCGNEVTVNCDECGIKCKLLYEGNFLLYSDDKKTEMMEKCFECDNYICFECAPDNRMKSNREFECKCARYIGSFCDDHQPVKGKCYKCCHKK
eukprot:499799_1